MFYYLNIRKIFLKHRCEPGSSCTQAGIAPEPPEGKFNSFWLGASSLMGVWGWGEAVAAWSGVWGEASELRRKDAGVNSWWQALSVAGESDTTCTRI